jgi:hypothetical protein
MSKKILFILSKLTPCRKRNHFYIETKSLSTVLSVLNLMINLGECVINSSGILLLLTLRGSFACMDNSRDIFL